MRRARALRASPSQRLRVRRPADFRNVELNGSQRNATPYYVQLRVTALSSTLPPKDSDPAITFTAIDDRGQEQQSITC